MRAPRQGQVDVELVETVGDAEVPAAEPGADWRELLRGVPARAWVAAAAVVALVAGVVVAVEWRADRAQAARIARTDGLTASLAEPLQELWRVPREGAVGVVGDVLVLYGGPGQGVLGVGTDDGVTRWEQPVGGSGWCWVERVGAEDERATVWSGGIRQHEPGTAVLACSDTLGGGIDDLSRTEVTVMDPERGDVLRRVDLGSTGSTAEVDDGVAVLGVDGEDRVVGSRWDILTGERVWEYVGPRVDQDSSGTATSHDGSTMTLRVGEVSVTLDLRTGRAVDTAGGGRPVTQELDRLPLADGGIAVSTAVDDERHEVVVHDEDGGLRFTTAGHALRPVADDGSAPRTLLLVSAKRPGIMAVDARTGDELWRSSISSWQVAVLAGLVVLRDQQVLTAVDARTGVTVWEHDDTAPRTGVSLLTDGRRLLTPVQVDGRTHLLTRDVETGREVWRAPAPGADGYLDRLPDGRVLVVGRGETVVLAP
ncbi:PQQ-binding-like beta-propeller repeat protein [Cellulomonas cellasea]|uniref:Pyrrolo-quinoline quinone repeat domain-containing protein n=2 Tax=Cellulomonas cellasea TaxID=43670 RepID=A0A0A0BBC6_9CELL|nr:PQQ-binding-like beta-propeller repeat protein [Cellulomonas cellasea]KGM02611.1 hypothetical protein Q760_12450 [Cellulomonas cellasea DSM 20118]GEA87774.1 hypothetical protein CCE01nite_17230 [Cellulomonas cellasea]